MADLDDFFAKRDKKKNKTKKFLSSEELVKQLEQAAKEKEQQKTKPEKIDEETTESSVKQENDDEWSSFQEEKKADLTNLKLRLIEDPNENNRNHQHSSGNDYEDDNVQNDGDNAENPWKKANASTPASSSKPEAVQKPEPVKSSAVYVPHHMRSENQMKSRSKKNAPDLQNEENFPSLGTEQVEPPKPKKADGFEEVKHGGKQQSASSGTAPVSIGNAYSSLLNDDS